jgi:hypothetical protein
MLNLNQPITRTTIMLNLNQPITGTTITTKNEEAYKILTNHGRFIVHPLNVQQIMADSSIQSNVQRIMADS